LDVRGIFDGFLGLDWASISQGTRNERLWFVGGFVNGLVPLAVDLWTVNTTEWLILLPNCVNKFELSFSTRKK